MRQVSGGLSVGNCRADAPHHAVQSALSLPVVSAPGRWGRFVRTFVFVVNGFTAMGGGLPFPSSREGEMNAAFTPILVQQQHLPLEVDMEHLSSQKIGQLCPCEPTVFCRYVLRAFRLSAICFSDYDFIHHRVEQAAEGKFK